MSVYVEDIGEMKAGGESAEFDPTAIAGRKSWKLTPFRFDLASAVVQPDSIVWPDGSRLEKQEA